MTDAAALKAPRSNLWNIGLWVVQVVLAFGFGAAGFMKLISPVETLASMMNWTTVVPSWLIPLIGVLELLGAAGIILPAATRIAPILTPLAAVGFAVIQVLAIGLHASLGETATTLPANLVLLILSIVVVWGRLRKAQ